MTKPASNVGRAVPRQAGFTMIEMVVVVAVMAAVASLVLLRQPFHSAGLDRDATERALISTLRLARSRAIVQDRDVAVVVTASGFSLDGGATRTVSAGQALTPARLVFSPDGGSSGGTVVLASPGTRVAFSVNWLTGRITTRTLEQP